nr:ribonuclease 3-like protein 3 isoform X1 [Ipomoea batatas]GMC88277.1 ribonuclease 3-like protein 3 isoform X1 [Ipomoea batatas]
MPSSQIRRASWLQSFWSPAKKWLASYGFIFNDFLGTKGNQWELKESLQEPGELMTESNIEEVEKIIGYNFNDKSLLCQAFTHISYHPNCVSYERLEYLGDSVINLMITKQQISTYPDLPPGLLSPLRAANVDTEKLARVAVKHKFHKYLRYKQPKIKKRINIFIDALPNYPLHSHGLIAAPKVLADVVESTVGAVFIDSNASLDKTWKVTKTLLEPIITPEMLEANPVRKLFEICQKHKLKVQLIDLWAQNRTCEVLVDNQFRGRGKCLQKKEVALNRAASEVYNEVVNVLGIKS